MKVPMAILFILLGLVFSTSSQSIPFLENEIIADGKLNEEVWNHAAIFKDFSNFFPINNGPARKDTEVKIFQDGKYLNISFVYHDSISMIKVNSLKRDNYGSGFHLSDHIGVIIDPYKNQNRGYYFAVNTSGVQLDALIANYDNENLSWDALWESGVSVSGLDKIYELKIPLSTFSYDNNITNWNFQFYTRDAKSRLYTVWNKFDRGFLQFDTRFLRPIDVLNLKPSKAAKSTLIPSMTSNYRNDIDAKNKSQNIQPSLDLQYKISDGLRLDATINPDFSQVDVDQQVTNLTRFNIIFPERRNFFIENSDIFSALGFASDINPFYSRFIGASQDLAFGIKLSGNLDSNTRLGILNVQSKKGDQLSAQNYSVAVLKQQFGPIINTTGYFINRQSNKDVSTINKYNRVGGLKVNYLSLNKKWSGFAGFSQSHNNHIGGDNSVFSISNSFQSRTVSFNTQLNKLGKNYFTDIGFAPRLNNYDAFTQATIREGYTELSQELLLYHYPKEQSIIQAYRPLFGRMTMYWDESGKRFESNYFYNTALFFTNQMSIYANLYHDQLDLKYAFDPLRNGNLIKPDKYNNTAIRFGWNTDYTSEFYGSINFQFGSFYTGNRARYGLNGGIRMLPTLSLAFNFEHNSISFDEIGNQKLNLMGLTTEVFLNNKLNWTTYIQYNEQINNININSRIQWEYKPLSFVYLVFTDNLDEVLSQKNWGVSLKINRRLNF